MEVEVKIETAGLNKALKRMCKTVIADLHSYAVQNIVKNATIDTGYLMKAVSFEQPKKVDELTVEGTIVFDAPYAACVEYGTYPGYYPPYHKIEKWVRRRLGIKKKSELREVTFKIIQHIHKHGTMPHPFFRPAIEMVKAKYSG